MKVLVPGQPDPVVARGRLPCAAKIADALGVTLDYLIKDGEYDHVDDETLKRLREIQKLSDENKSHVYALLDAFIKQTKLQAIL